MPCVSAMSAAQALVVVGGVDGQADDLHAPLVELGLGVGHVVELGGADGREVLGVGEQHGPGVAQPVVEFDASLGGVGLEVGGFVAKL